MKKKLHILCFVLFVPIIGLAQNKEENEEIPVLFTISDKKETLTTSTRSTRAETSSKNNKMRGMLNNPMHFEIRKMAFPNLMEMTNQGRTSKKSPGYFRFSIPKNKGKGKRKRKAMKNILAVPKHIEVGENGDYTYNAEILYKKELQGDLTLIHKDGKNFGSFSIGNRYFRIESYDDMGNLLIEIDPEEIKEKFCDTQSNYNNYYGGKTSKQKSSKISKRKDKEINNIANIPTVAPSSMMNGPKTVRVLALYTNAANAVSNPSQFAQTAVNEMNQALRNSTIYSSQVSYVLVGTANVTLGANTEDANDDLTTEQSNPQIIALRNQYGADLVAVLINRNYGGSLGIAPLDEYQDSNTGYVCFVEADSFPKVFGHEISHMMGCRHDTDSRTGNSLPNNLSETAKGHQWYKRNCFFCQKLFRKSLTASGGTGGLIRLFYSNPNVTEESKSRGPTGTSVRNNYLQILSAKNIVSEYNSFEPLLVGIDGSGFVNVGAQYTLTSSVTNCNGSPTYKWERSENGFSYFQVGTSSTYSSFAFPISGNQVYYRLTVICDGQTIVRTRTVYIFDPDDPFGGGLQVKTSINSLDLEDTESENQSMVMYPNPANNEINYTGHFDEEQKVTIMLYGVAPWGYQKKLFKSKVRKGRNDLLFNVSNIPQGLYQFKVIGKNGTVFEKRLLISR